MNWIRGSLTDSEGNWDVAYISLAGVMGAVFTAIMTMTAMSVVAYLRCQPVVRETQALVTCIYDPQPLGIAIGAACGGFATALGALAGYMLATRPGTRPSTITTRTESVVKTDATVADKEPIDVNLVSTPEHPAKKPVPPKGAKRASKT